MAYIEPIGTRIARLRRKSGLKQLELAQRAGLNPSSLNQIERGKRKPKIETVTAIAKQLSVSRDLILDGDPAAAPQPTTDDAPSTTPQSAELSATIQTAIAAGLADLATAIAAALADWHETYTARETGSTATGTTGRAAVRRNARR